MKKILKSFFAVLLVAAIVFEIVPLIAFADNTLAATGRCGDNVYWSFNEGTGTLTISGTGDMYGYYGYSMGPFSNNNAIKSVIIEHGVSSVGAYSFYRCSSITNITIPDSVIDLGGWSFFECKKITSFPSCNGVTNIRDYAFYNCTGLISAILPDGIKSIGGHAFQGCTEIKTIELSDDLTHIGEYAFYNCNSLTDLIIPNNVKNIARNAFYDCRSITKIEIPDSVTSIGEKAFDNCPLTTVTMGNGLTTIPRTLINISYLKSFVIGNSVTRIDDWAFSNCILTSIKIGNAIKFIGSGAFNNCNHLKDIVFHGSETEWEQIEIDSTNTRFKSLTIKYEQHKYISETTASTCTKKGSTTFKCSICSKTYVDCVTAELGHDYHATITSPTCTNQGYTTYICSRCENNYIDNYTDVLGHNFGDWKVTTPSTCIAKGTKTRYCSRCTATETRAIDYGEHKYIPSVTDPICTQKGYTTYTCSVCNNTYIDNYVNAKGHTPGEWIVTVEPTTETEGIKTMYCYACGEFLQSAVIPIILLLKVQSVSIGNVSLGYLYSTTIKPTITADSGAIYTVTYTSSNPSVATIDNNGKVTSVKQFGLSRGSTVITCTVTDNYGNTVSDTCKVTVNFTWWQWLLKIVLFGWIWY